MAKVLIIESDAAVAKKLSTLLSARGIESQITADGAEGVNLARSFAPDVIVLCVELSRVSGYSICNKLKKDPDLGRIPLVLTSSQATEETFEQHKKLKTRAEAYVKKPYGDAEIVSIVGGLASGGSGGDAELDVSLDDVAVDVDVGGGASSAHAGSSADLEFAIEPDPPAAPVRAAPAARPAAAARPASTAHATASTAARPAGAAASGAGSDSTRAENQTLRQKVQKLEQALEQKELEFNDRLLQESSRGREAVDLKKKLTLVERDLLKFQGLAEKGKSDAEAAKAELEELRGSHQGVESDKQALSGKMSQLVEKVKSLAAERDALQQEVADLKDQIDKAAQENDSIVKVRDKAKKAVDIAVQLLDETGLLQ